MSKGKLFDKPQGPSEKGWSVSTMRRYLPYDECVCEACGSKYTCGKDLTEVEAVDLMGVQIIKECCGAYLDKLFKSLGQTFCHEYLLDDFRRNPLGQEKGITRFVISEAIQAWLKAAEKAQEEAKKAAAMSFALRISEIMTEDELHQYIKENMPKWKATIAAEKEASSGD